MVLVNLELYKQSTSTDKQSIPEALEHHSSLS